MERLCVCALFVAVLIPAFAESDVQAGSDMQLSGYLLEPFDLHLDESALVTSENITIKLLNVTNDSRCPSDVTCIWQGAVHAEVSVKKDGADYGVIGLDLGGDGNAEVQVFDKYFIQLLKVEPYPKTSHEIQPSEYVATLIVKKKAELILSPTQQFKSGVQIDQIQCREGLTVAIKASNGNPVCVKLETMQKLIQRGWLDKNSMNQSK